MRANVRRQPLYLIAAIGLAISLVLNLLGLLNTVNSAARFFADEWWSTWFPSYFVWILFAVIGAFDGRAKINKKIVPFLVVLAPIGGWGLGQYPDTGRFLHPDDFDRQDWVLLGGIVVIVLCAYLFGLRLQKLKEGDN